MREALPVLLHKHPAALLNAIKHAIWEASELDGSQVHHKALEQCVVTVCDTRFCLPGVK